MNRKLKIAIPVIAGVLAISSGIGIVAAKSADQNTLNRPAVSYDLGDDGAAQPCDGYGNMRGHGWGFQSIEEIAGLLGTTPEDIRAQLGEGKTLAEIASAQGISQEQLIEVMLARHQEHMAYMVENGYLTPEEADNLTQQARERFQSVITGQFDDEDSWGHMRGMMGGFGRGMMSGWQNRQPAPDTSTAPQRGYGGMMGGFGRGMMGW